MGKIVSIGTALPEFCHSQQDILKFMQNAFNLDDTDKRKLAFLYSQSGIKQRYSVIEDFSRSSDEWSFIPSDIDHPFPTLEKRLDIYQQLALPLSVKAIENCIEGFITAGEITHLITVSCTGMSAPGLDLQIAEALDLPANIFRTSVNFMGCYATIHAMKIAKMICDTEPKANVVIVSTELCTIHFQKEYTLDNAASSLLFSDGSAAMLVTNNHEGESPSMKSFSSQISLKGKKDMAWELSSKGFLMTLSGYIPQLIQEDINALLENALKQSGTKKEDITHWCIHPGGKKIIDVIQRQLQLNADDLKYSADILSRYGNMSSTTILFVLKEILQAISGKATVFGIAFGPGLTMETFVVSDR